MAGRPVQQVKPGNFVHHPGKQGCFRIDVGDAAGDDPGQCGDLGGVLPELIRHLLNVQRQGRIGQALGEERHAQAAQGGETEPGDSGRQVVDFALQRVVGQRIGQGHNASGQYRFGGDQLCRFAGVAAGVGKGAT